MNILNLGGNEIYKIENLDRLINLSRLNLEENQINKIENLDQLKNLTKLILYGNQISKIENLDELYSLNELDLNGNQISKIENLNNLNNLIDLKLGFNKIYKLENLENLPSLTKLDLIVNQISKIENLEQLFNLTKLSLGYNNIVRIENLIELRNLSTLNLEGNRINQIHEFDYMPKLERLELSDNQITKIEGLSNLKSLIELNLDSNLIKEIPSFEELPNIKEFYFYNNQIESFPKEFIESIKDRKDMKVHIHENPFLEKSEIYISDYLYFDDDITNHFDQLIHDYVSIFQETNKGKLPIPTKIALFGNSNVGKSHLREFLIKGGVLGKVKSTPTLEIHHWLEETNEINVNIYDFGGQDFYHATYQMFFTLDTFYLIIWDHETNRNQINQERADSRPHDYFEFDVSFWLGNIEYGLNRVRPANHDNSIAHIFLLRNKIDMDQQLSFEQIKNSQVKLFKTQGNYSIDHAFDMYLEDNNSKYSRYRQFFKESLLEALKSQNIKVTTRNREHVVTKILEIRNNGNWDSEIKYADLYSELQKHLKEVHKIDFNSSLRILRNSGLILWYEFEDSLKHLIWLYPQNVASRIHDLLQESSKEGFILEKDYEEKFGNLKQVLVQQHISFYDENFFKGPSYIIPQYLPVENTNDPLFQIAKGGLNHVFSIQCIDFMPFGIFNRIAAYFGGNPDQKYYVKNKIIFTLDKVKILIEVDPLLLIIHVKWIQLADNKANPLKSYLFRTILTAYWDGTFRKYGEHEIKHNDKVGEYMQSSYEPLFERKRKPTKRIDLTNAKTKWDFYQDLKDKKNLLNKFRLSIDSEALYYSDYLDIVNASENPLENPYVDAFYLNLDSNKPLKKQHQLHLYNAFVDIKKDIPKKLFISYSSKNSDFMKRFTLHLESLRTEGLISYWTDRMIDTGVDWDEKIQKELDQADRVIYLLCPYFLVTPYIMDKELSKGFKKEEDKPGSIQFIHLQHCNWKIHSKLTEYQHLLDPTIPEKKLVVVENAMNDEAWVKITEDLRNILKDKH